MPCGFELLGGAHRVLDLFPRHEPATDRRTNAVFVAWSRSHGLVEPASRTFRINDMKTPATDREPSQDAPDRSAVDLDSGARHVRRLRPESRNAPTRPNSSPSP